MTEEALPAELKTSWVPGEEPEGAFIGDARRDVIVAAGPEVIDYLQGQISQDVSTIGVGETSWSFLLEPNGKVLGHLRLTRTDAETLIIDVDEGMGEAVCTSLDRFKLRSRVTFELTQRATGGRLVVGLRGVEAVALASGIAGDDGVVVPTLWPGSAADVLLGLGASLPSDLPAGVAAIDDEAWESARIRAGVPRVGSDIDGSTIPAESGLVPRSVSFTKGCYRGQELVERIDSRGAVRRQLCSLVTEGSVRAGDTLHVQERQVGIVTSATRGIRVSMVALGYVRTEAFSGAALVTSSGVPVHVSVPA